MPHQEAELEFLLSRPRAFLFSDVGTGKTPVLLTYAAQALGSGRRVLWVTEASLVRQLKHEARLWLPLGLQPSDLKSSVGPFQVTSFEGLLRNSRTPCNGGFDVVVVDEADALACGVNPHASTFRAMKSVLAASERSVLATATPVATAHALDLHALLSAGHAPDLATRGDFERWIRFEDCPIEGGGFTRQPMGIRDPGIAHLQAVIQLCAVRTSLEQIDARLPRVIREDLEVDLSAGDLATYSRVRHAPSLRGHQLRQKASRSVTALTEAAVSLLLEGEGSHHSHAVVFTENRDILNPLLSMLVEGSRPVWEITGSQTLAARDRAVRLFNEAPSGILVGTQAIETGLNLQRASLLVTVVPSWTPARETQREGRLRRHGSSHALVKHVTIRPRASIEVAKVRRHRLKDDVASRIVSSIPDTAPQKLVASG